jgi:hypothetical protein
MGPWTIRGNPYFFGVRAVLRAWTDFSEPIISCSGNLLKESRSLKMKPLR